jgi:hypothetical protein
MVLKPGQAVGCLDMVLKKIRNIRAVGIEGLGNPFDAVTGRRVFRR